MHSQRLRSVRFLRSHCPHYGRIKVRRRYVPQKGAVILTIYIHKSVPKRAATDDMHLSCCIPCLLSNGSSPYDAVNSDHLVVARKKNRLSDSKYSHMYKIYKYYIVSASWNLARIPRPRGARVRRRVVFNNFERGKGQKKKKYHKKMNK